MDTDQKRLVELKEQHKNTRHDAVDKLLEVRADYEKYTFSAVTDQMFERMLGAIMNLKQRKPE